MGLSRTCRPCYRSIVGRWSHHHLWKLVGSQGRLDRNRLELEMLYVERYPKENGYRSQWIFVFRLTLQWSALFKLCSLSFNLFRMISLRSSDDCRISHWLWCILNMFVLEDVGTMNLFMVIFIHFLWFFGGRSKYQCWSRSPSPFGSKKWPGGWDEHGRFKTLFSSAERSFFLKVESYQNAMTVAGWLLIYCSFFCYIWYDKLRINKDSVWNSMSLLILRRW